MLNPACGTSSKPRWLATEGVPAAVSEGGASGLPDLGGARRVRFDGAVFAAPRDPLDVRFEAVFETGLLGVFAIDTNMARAR